MTHYVPPPVANEGNVCFFTVTKYLLTAGVIALLSELVKRSDKMGALVAVMPIVKIIVLIGRGIENQPKKTANHNWYAFC